MPENRVRIDLSVHGQAATGQALDKSKRKVRDLGTETGHANRGLLSMSGAATRLTGALAGLASVAAAIRLGKEIVDLGQTYQGALTDMAKVTDQSREAINADIAALDAHLGNSTDLVQGYYQVISAGVTDPAKALDMLVEASKMAKAAHVDQADAIKGLTKMMAGYGDEIKSTSDAADILFAIEKVGQTTVLEMVPLIGEMSSVSAQLGVRVGEMGAAFANITQFTGSSSQAMTSYKAIVMGLFKPNEEMRKALAALGYESGQAMVQALNFAGAIKAVDDYARNSGVGLGRMFESQEALIGLGPMIKDLFRMYSDGLRVFEERADMSARAWINFSEDGKAASEAFWDVLHNVAIQIEEVFDKDLTDALNNTTKEIQENTREIVLWTKAIKGTIAAVKDLYDLIPDNTVSGGILGRMLFGSWGGGAVVLMLQQINRSLEAVGSRLSFTSLMREWGEDWKAFIAAIRGDVEWLSGAPTLAAQKRMTNFDLVPAHTPQKSLQDIGLLSPHTGASLFNADAMQAAIDQVDVSGLSKKVRGLEKDFLLLGAAENKTGDFLTKGIADYLGGDALDTAKDQIRLKRELVDQTKALEIETSMNAREQNALRFAEDRRLLEQQISDYKKRQGYSADADDFIAAYRQAKLRQVELAELRASNNFAAGWDSGINKVKDSMLSGFEMMESMAVTTAKSMGQAFGDFFFDLTQNNLKSLADYVQSFANSVLRSMTAMLGQQMASGIMAGMFHSGGMVGDTVVPGRMVPASVFAGAPRLHSGLAPDEYPAILQRGEKVIPRGGGSRPANITVVLKNESGQPMKLTRQETSPGQDPQEIVVTLWMDAVQNNRFGVRSFLGGG